MSDLLQQIREDFDTSGLTNLGVNDIAYMFNMIDKLLTEIKNKDDVLFEMKNLQRYAIDHGMTRSTMTASPHGGFILWPDVGRILDKWKNNDE